MPKLDIQLDIGENYYEPMEFVEAVKFAEDCGFRTAWLGDHFLPWFHSGKRSAFVWSVLAVALERTKDIKLGPLVTTPIGARYHPAIIAQSSATLDNMYPGRFLLGVGTGEALNETPFWNGNWPQWEERMERLSEGIQLIRRLWREKEPFEHKGKHFSSDFYFLYTKPKTNIPLYFAAAGKRAAHSAGLYADNLVTLAPRASIEKLREEIVPSFREGRREAGKRGGGLVVHMDFSFQKPAVIMKQSWRTLGWLLKDSWSIPNPVKVEEAGKRVTVSDIEKGIYLLRGWRDVVGMIEKFKDLGASAVILVSEGNKKRIKEFADNLLTVV